MKLQEMNVDTIRQLRFKLGKEEADKQIKAYHNSLKRGKKQLIKELRLQARNKLVARGKCKIGANDTSFFGWCDRKLFKNGMCYKHYTQNKESLHTLKFTFKSMFQSIRDIVKVNENISISHRMLGKILRRRT